MSDLSLPIYSIVAEGCLRCGACSTLAPGIIKMGESAAVIVRQPTTPEEVRSADAALFNCVMLLIRKKSPGL